MYLKTTCSISSFFLMEMKGIMVTFIEWKQRKFASLAC